MPLVRALERGRGLERGVIAQTRAFIGGGKSHRAESIAEGLRRDEATRPLGLVAGGIVAFHRGYVELAWAQLREVPRAMWLEYAAAEYVRSGLAVEPERTLDEVRRLAADDPPEARAKTWFDVLAPVFGLGETELAQILFARFDRHVDEDDPVWSAAAEHRDWMRPWIGADPDSPSAPPPPGGRRTVAILDYGHPSRMHSSSNLGDHIQSLAALGHLVRHERVRMHAEPELLAVLDELRGRTRPERRLQDVDAEVEVRTVHRDASTYQPIAEDTWVLCSGWFMHPLFKMRHAFPLHRNLRPIFVSFHCNKRELLTDEAIEYLRTYGPVGCRDWTTVYLLLSIGVPAFFSGCLTTTIDTVFPAAHTPPPEDAPVAYVDIPAEQVPPDGVAYRHTGDDVRVRPFLANVREALERLETYRSRHRAVVTSRLHCYLPVRSIGAPVEFRPRNPSDIRFDGLLGVDDAAFDAMRQGLDDKLERVLAAVFRGGPEAEVYALWRELTAADVAEAERSRGHEDHLAPVGEHAGPDLAADVVQRGVPAADAVHVAVLADGRHEEAFGALTASLLEHASRPLQLWVLTQWKSEGLAERLARRFPAVTAGQIRVHDLRRDVIPLLLGALLPGVGRVVVLPLPAIATGDVAELADLDLGPYALAAPRRPGTTYVSGFGVIHNAAGRLRERTEASGALRRTAHARHRFDFDACDTDVLVLDLARLRDEALAERAPALSAEYDLSGGEVVHYLFGPRRAIVPERWAIVPTRSPQRERGLLHWADPVKPWQPELTPERERWRAYLSAAGSS